MGTSPPYTLNALSEKEPWNLFRKMTYEDGLEPERPEVLKAAKEIVNKQANVPLVIRTLGSLL